MFIIDIPRTLNLYNSINFCKNLWSLPESEHYDFNFANLSFLEPFTMAYVANELKRYRNTKPDVRFSASNHKSHTYAAHMGFFKAFGLQYGHEPGEASGSSTYLPLTIINVAELKHEAASQYIHIGDLIEEKSSQIAQLLTRQESGDIVDTLTFSIREIMRNVVEHSNSEVIEYCAQYWPNKKLVEVAILDTGDGIQKSLSNNPHLHIESERDALHFALMPGISGKMYSGVRKTGDAWQNSGFGLYMTSRICRNGGSFFIASNDNALLLTKGDKKDKSCIYKGTALRLRINTSNITSYNSMLASYKEEGFNAAKKFSSSSTIEPSLASTMLARDFAKN